MGIGTLILIFSNLILYLICFGLKTTSFFISLNLVSISFTVCVLCCLLFVCLFFVVCFCVFVLFCVGFVVLFCVSVFLFFWTFLGLLYGFYMASIWLL